jgi:hypothetical protein
LLHAADQFLRRGIVIAKAASRLFFRKRKGHLLFPLAFIPLT